ncbi:transcription factor bHLH130-like [Musa acuminata AAA Group]|uniref:transcription factor bHLH130-like n=1 Tax=Musa acuminata AAA Group TaxID=214697 RepID=UPI0031D2C099
MYGSPLASSSSSKGLNLPHAPTVPFGGHREEDAASELFRGHPHHHHHQQMNPGLLRYRSAPSSLFEEPCENSLRATLLSAETENKGGTVGCQRSPQFRQPPPVPSSEMVSSQQRPAYSSALPTMYHHCQQQLQMHNMPNHSLAEISQRAVGSMATEMQRIENGAGRNSTNLTRQSSSPAGLFSPLDVDAGYGKMMGLDGFGNGDLLPMGDAANRLKDQMSFLPRQNSLMSKIPELGSEEVQNGGMMMKHVSGLRHQLSLPKTSSEMAAVENFLQFQDAVPCRTRAKRGCATHPRSIAERVRRTKISERIRKLQELVPNMDKQTNTADMLDLAVDYIHDLQKQVKALTEGRASCTCSRSKQQS